MPYKEEMAGIYLIFCRTSKKKYIGSSNYIYHRWSQHKECLRRNGHHNKHLQSAWNKYGEDSFKFSILEQTNLDNLLEREQYWIDKLDVCNRQKGYNVSPLATGKIMSEESKKKIADKQRGKKHSEESLQKMREAHKGFKHTEESKRKLSEAGRGRQHTLEAKQKISQAKSGYKYSDEARQNMSLGQLNQSDETRKKRSEAAKNRSFHGHTGKLHSEESKLKMSESAKKRKIREKDRKSVELYMAGAFWI